jgi:hypothetical protein
LFTSEIDLDQAFEDDISVAALAEAEEVHDEYINVNAAD